MGCVAGSRLGEESLDTLDVEKNSIENAGSTISTEQCAKSTETGERAKYGEQTTNQWQESKADALTLPIERKPQVNHEDQTDFIAGAAKQIDEVKSLLINFDSRPIGWKAGQGVAGEIKAKYNDKPEEDTYQCVIKRYNGLNIPLASIMQPSESIFVMENSTCQPTVHKPLQETGDPSWVEEEIEPDNKNSGVTASKDGLTNSSVGWPRKRREGSDSAILHNNSLPTNINRLIVSVKKANVRPSRSRGVKSDEDVKVENLHNTTPRTDELPSVIRPDILEDGLSLLDLPDNVMSGRQDSSEGSQTVPVNSVVSGMSTNTVIDHGLLGSTTSKQLSEMGSLQSPITGLCVKSSNFLSSSVTAQIEEKSDEEQEENGEAESSSHTNGMAFMPSIYSESESGPKIVQTQYNEVALI